MKSYSQKKAKRSQRKAIVFFKQFVKQFSHHLAVLLIEFPYFIWKVFFPKRKSKSNPISKIFRRVLELKRTRQAVGVNLATALIILSLVQTPAIANGMIQNNTEDSQLKAATPVITTQTTFREPVPGYISQSYSWHHPGIDIAGNDNSLIYPVAPGRVVEIENGRFGYGLNILVDHGDGIVSRYAHMQEVDVALNQEVTKDTVIGHVGSTGWSTGPHLHLEIYQNGRTTNPVSFFPDVYSYTYVNIPAPAPAPAGAANNNRILAAQNSTATFSAQIVSKEVASGFTEPNAYVSTPSASGK